MNKVKRILIGVTALVMSLSLAACSEGSSEKESSQEDAIKVVTTDDIKPIAEGEENTLIWMANYDLNPSSGGEKTVGLNLFEQKGGKIEWSRVTSSNQYTKLGAAVTSGKNVPDLFVYSALAFPCQVIQGFYQPLDDIIDFDDPLWKDVKDTADQYSLAGKHYVAPIEYYPSSYIFYDKDVINESGLEDPTELYYAGEWDFDAMDELMSAYVKAAPSGEERFGINGFYAPQYVQQTGETLVMTDDNETYRSNLDSPKIAKAEERLYNWRKEGYVEPNWIQNAGEAFNKNILFYAMGDWAATGSGGPTKNDNWGIVPMPADPDYEGDKPITSASMNSFMWVNGSEKKDAARAFYECYRVAQTDTTYLQNAKDKWLEDNPYWSVEDYELMKEVSNPNNNLMIFEPSYGVSALMGDDNSGFMSGQSLTNWLYRSTSGIDEQGETYTWTQTKEKFSSTVDTEIQKINKQIKEFLAKNK